MVQAATDVTDAAAPDGRRARRERGREAVLDAMVDLVQSGDGAPTPHAVAERAGVSVASLFRYFPTLDELREQVTARVLERYADRIDIPGLGEGPLRGRIGRFVRARLALWTTLAPILRLLRVRASDDSAAAGLVREMRRRFARQAEEHFAPELAARTPAVAADLVALITATTSFEAWELLHRDLDRSHAQIARAWTTALRALLASPTDS